MGGSVCGGRVVIWLCFVCFFLFRGNEYCLGIIRNYGVVDSDGVV